MPRRRVLSADPPSIDTRPQLGASVIKSAQRVIELFELFSDVQMGITVADVASRLKMPQSSTSALLRSLHTMGYLDIDSEQRTYFPTSRVALLGHWVDPLLVQEGPLIKMARQVAEETGFDTFLATQNKLNVQIVYRQNAASSGTHNLTGAGGFLALAATGQILLSQMSDREVTKLITATNAQLPGHLAPVNPREALLRLAEVRQQGFAAAPSQRSPGMITIAVRLPDITVEPMVFGMSIPREQVDRPEQWVDRLNSAVKTWIDS